MRSVHSSRLGIICGAVLVVSVGCGGGDSNAPAGVPPGAAPSAGAAGTAGSSGAAGIAPNGGTGGAHGGAIGSGGGGAAGTAGGPTGGIGGSAGGSTGGAAGATGSGNAGSPGGGGSGTAGMSGTAGSSGSGGTAASGGAAGSGMGGSAGGLVGGSGGVATGGSAGSTSSGGSSVAGFGGSTSGGSGGTGAAGSAGTGGGVVVDPGAIGSICDVDADCGGSGWCLAATSTEIFHEGPANGYCSYDCSAWLAAAIADPTTTEPDPCDPNGTGAAVCLNFAATATDPPKGFCVQSCTWGAPPIDNQTMIGALDPNKCSGRLDSVCVPLVDASTNALQGAYCRPFCMNDTECPNGYVCDASIDGGGCVPSGALPTPVRTNESACDPTSTTRQCQSDCFTLYSADDPATAKIDESKLGMCWDSCEDMSKSSCQGHNGDGTAYCGVYPYTTPTVNGVATLPGLQDVALCSNLWGTTGDPSQITDDNHCYWEAHMFMQNFGSASMPVGACIFQPSCTTDADCVYDCTSAADCNAGDTCVSGKCQTASGPDDMNRHCVAVPELGASYCIDHVPPALTPTPNLPPGAVIP